VTNRADAASIPPLELVVEDVDVPAEEKRREPSCMSRNDGLEFLKRYQVRRPQEMRPPAVMGLPHDDVATVLQELPYREQKAVGDFHELHLARPRPTSTCTNPFGGWIAEGASK
jgi:hypothetical protein